MASAGLQFLNNYSVKYGFLRRHLRKRGKLLHCARVAGYEFFKLLKSKSLHIYMQGKREEICLQNNQPSTSYSIKNKIEIKHFKNKNHRIEL